MKKLIGLVLLPLIFYVPQCGQPATPKPGTEGAIGTYQKGYGCTEPYRRYTSSRIDNWWDNVVDFGPYQTFCSEGYLLFA